MALDFLSPVKACVERPRTAGIVELISASYEAIGTRRILRGVRYQPPVVVTPRPLFSCSNHALLQPLTAPRFKDPGSCQVRSVRPPTARFNAAKRHRLSVIPDPPHAVLWKGWVVMWQASTLKRLQHLTNVRRCRVNDSKSHHDASIIGEISSKFITERIHNG
jgi:hypothetical protein